MPFIQARIKNFLSETVRVNEFAHTILHKQVAPCILAKWTKMTL